MPTTSKKETRYHIGLISDTHGLMRPEAVVALRGSEMIIHSGDIGRPEILNRLRELAPVFAVCGNVDQGRWAEATPVNVVVEVAGISIFVLHDLNEIDLDPAAAGFRVVISGHSHRPSVVTQKGVLYVNPGSAGPRRFSLPVSVGRLTIQEQTVSARIIELESKNR